jgi:hypothetical protein
MSKWIWVKYACTDEAALKVTFEEGMDIDELTTKIVEKRKSRHCTNCNVAKIYIKTENRGEIVYTAVAADKKIACPSDESSFGFNAENPYYFVSDLGINC